MQSRLRGGPWLSGLALAFWAGLGLPRSLRFAPFVCGLQLCGSKVEVEVEVEVAVVSILLEAPDQ